MSVLNNSLNANSSTPLSTVEGGSGVSNPTAHGIAIGEGSGAINSIVLGAGQLLIGNTSGDPSPTTLTAGSNITITPTSGAITIASSGGGSSFTWTSVVTSTVNMTNNTGYVINYTGGNSVTFTLPTTSNVGDTISVDCNELVNSSMNWTILQNSGQVFNNGPQNSTVTTGTLYSGQACSDVTFVCIVADTVYSVIYGTGTILKT
jgi:hypothetical protein